MLRTCRGARVICHRKRKKLVAKKIEGSFLTARSRRATARPLVIWLDADDDRIVKVWLGLQFFAFHNSHFYCNCLLQGVHNVSNIRSGLTKRHAEMKSR